jgi:phage baseplate assembly protein gpV
MSLKRATADVDRARADLDRVRALTAGWHDSARHRFDNQRLDPLADLAKQVVAALKRADQEIGMALRSLAD